MLQGVVHDHTVEAEGVGEFVLGFGDTGFERFGGLRLTRGEALVQGFHGGRHHENREEQFPEGLLELQPAFDVHVEHHYFILPPQSVHLRTQRAVEAVLVNFLPFDELARVDAAFEFVYADEVVVHAIGLGLPLGSRRGRDGEGQARIGIEQVADDGRLAAARGSAEEQEFSLHGIRVR